MARTLSLFPSLSLYRSHGSASKYPKLRPASKPTIFSSKLSPNPELERDSTSTICVPKRKKKRLPASSSSRHHMVTRFKASQFRLWDLPAEIRNRIYAFAFTEQDSLSLVELKLPPALSLCRQLRTEALPVFFAVNTFESSITSNWDVNMQYLHTRKHIEIVSVETGYARLSALLVTPESGSTVPISLLEQTVRFHRLQFRIECFCCMFGKQIGNLELYVEGHKAMANRRVTFRRGESTAVNLEKMFRSVDLLVELMNKEERFNGFSVEHIKLVATCFRLEE